MENAAISDRHWSWAVWGRLALAFVSARARTCPHGTCGRQRRCLARFRPTDNFHTEAGNCRIMTGAEWRSVSLGMRGNAKLLDPYLDGQRAKRDAEDEAREKAEKLSREERFRRYCSPEEVAKRAAAEKERLSRPGYEYAWWLWIRDEGDKLYFPRDVVAEGERLIAIQRGRGCRCVEAGRLECEDEEECFRRMG